MWKLSAGSMSATSKGFNAGLSLCHRLLASQLIYRRYGFQYQIAIIASGCYSFGLQHYSYGMVTNLRFKFLFSMVMMVALSGFQLRAADEDVQIWNSIKLSYKANELLTASTVLEGRFYDDVSHLRHKRVGQMLEFSVNESVIVGFNFRHTLKRSSAGARSTEDRWELSLQHRLHLTKNWRWDMRHRLEQVAPGGDEPFERSRHLVRARKKIDGRGSFKQYFANAEAFFSFDAQKIVETRVVPIGLSFAVRDSTTLSAAYLLRSVRKSATWEHAHALLVGISVKL